MIVRFKRFQCPHPRRRSAVIVDVRRGKRQQVTVLELCERCARKVRRECLQGLR